MSKLLKNCLNTFILSFIILCLFSFVKSEIENIKLNEGNFSDNYNIQNESEFSKFKVEGVKDDKILRIKVKSYNENFADNFIISYYQEDAKFMERKQLSQSFINTTLMWLTYAQIEKDFYFSVECKEYPCSYTLDLNTLNSSEITIDDQYTYYVTEENKKMNFKIKSNPYIESLTDKSDYIITIWAKGSKEINTSLEGLNSEKFPNHNYYTVNLEDFSESNNFVIEGKAGDLINIGLLLLKTEESNIEKYLITESILKYNGIEIMGSLKGNEKIIFKLNEYAYNLEVPYNLETNEELLVNYNEDEVEGYYSVELRNYGNENIIFSYKFYKENKDYKEGKNINYPQLIGFRYSKQIEEGKTVGLIPMKIDDFNFLTYEVINSDLKQRIKVAIYECENYPSCNNGNKIEGKIDIYKWFNYYKFSQKNWTENISPISKKQNLLLIKCEKGIKFNDKNSCFIKEDMIIDKDTINMTGFSEANRPLYKFISKNEINKFSFKGSEKEIYLNIETIAGKIDVAINTKEKYNFYNKGNNYLYIFPSKTNLDITIKGIKNSLYLFEDIYPIIFNENKINVGEKYFVKIKDQLTLEPGEYFDQKSEIKKDFYMGIYPIDCDLSVESFKNERDDKIVLAQKKGFYQDIFSNLDSKYTFINKKPSKDCLFYISYFELDDEYGISLEDDNDDYQLFALDSNRRKLKFTYMNIKQDNENTDVNFYFKFENEGNYQVQLHCGEFIQGAMISSNNQNYNYKLTLKSEKLDDNCKYYNICKLFLTIESENLKKESIFGINVSKKSKEENKKNEDKIQAIILICISAFLLIIVIIIIFIIFTTLRKNKDIRENIYKTSFQFEKSRGESLIQDEED